MNSLSLFYAQIGIDVLMCGLILYFLWRVGVKREMSGSDGEEARRELQRLVIESQQSAQQFLDALGEGRRTLKELASALDERETRLQALCQRIDALLADAMTRNVPGDPANGYIDREQVLRMNKDGAPVSDIIRKTGMTEGEVHLIIDLARSQNENR
jgi:hypothetical protein